MSWREITLSELEDIIGAGCTIPEGTILIEDGTVYIDEDTHDSLVY